MGKDVKKFLMSVPEEKRWQFLLEVLRRIREEKARIEAGIPMRESSRTPRKEVPDAGPAHDRDE